MATQGRFVLILSVALMVMLFAGCADQSSGLKRASDPAGDLLREIAGRLAGEQANLPGIPFHRSVDELEKGGLAAGVGGVEDAEAFGEGPDGDGLDETAPALDGDRAQDHRPSSPSRA